MKKNKENSTLGVELQGSFGKKKKSKILKITETKDNHVVAKWTNYDHLGQPLLQGMWSESSDLLFSLSLFFWFPWWMQAKSSFCVCWKTSSSSGHFFFFTWWLIIKSKTIKIDSGHDRCHGQGDRKAQCRQRCDYIHSNTIPYILYRSLTHVKVSNLELSFMLCFFDEDG